MKTTHLLIACICSLLPWAVSAQSFTSVDIYTGADSSNPYYFVEYNSNLYFVANDGVHGNELWVSDGTQGGSHLVKDIWPGSGSSNIYQLTAVNGKLYFEATDSVHGYEMWVSDGTSGGTNMVKDIYPGTTSSYAGYYGGFAALNGKVYFTAGDSAHGYELWSTDGTTAGTALVADIDPGTGSGYPGYYGGFYPFNDKLYFDATDGVHGDELWVTDGTTGGTNMVADIWPGAGSGYPGYIDYGSAFTVANNKIFFMAEDSLHGYELWASDGTTGGTTRVADIWPGKTGSYAGFYGGFITYNGKAYFEADDSTHGYELWSSDGTAGGTNLVKDAWPGIGNSYPEFFALFNNKLYYNAADTSANYQLWSSDGTTAGTHAVTSLYTGYSDGLDPYQPTPLGSQLFFTGDDSVQGYQLYSITASDSLTMYQPPIATTIGPLNADGQLAVLNGSLAFAASYNSIGNELWFFGPVTTAINPVKVLNGISVYPNPFTSQISLTGLQNGVEYHLTLTDIQGRELENYQLTGTGATNTLNLPATLASGMYLLQLSNGDAAETVKMVKE